VERLGPAITSDSLRRFALAARRKLRNEDGTYRRNHLRALAQRVEAVDPSEILIMGSKNRTAPGSQLVRFCFLRISAMTCAYARLASIPLARL
jgi:hypothetical protein